MIARERFLTLDVFRGLTIFLMIIVNTPGSGAAPFAPLLHADWHGFTLTDLVFPAFLFAVGNAMAFAMDKWKGYSHEKVIARILKRGLLIFVVGYLLTWYTSMYWNSEGRLSFVAWEHTRVLAVLQRIAICFVIAAVMARYFSLRWNIIISCLLLLAYWAILYGCGDQGAPYSIAGNAVRKFDLLVLGEAHMYRERGIVFDPEGLLSTIPATVNVTAGWMAGVFIRKKGKSAETVSLLMIIANALIVTGLLWDFSFPINKKLWTSSFVLYTTGINLAALGFLFYFIEMRKWTTGVYFFSVFGKNPLFIYVLSNLLMVLLIWPVTREANFIDWINTVFFQAVSPGPLGSLLFSLCFTLLCWSVGWILDRRRIYIRL